jgi:hypothetical protein
MRVSLYLILRAEGGEAVQVGVRTELLFFSNELRAPINNTFSIYIFFEGGVTIFASHRTDVRRFRGLGDLLFPDIKIPCRHVQRRTTTFHI